MKAMNVWKSVSVVVLNLVPAGLQFQFFWLNVFQFEILIQIMGSFLQMTNDIHVYLELLK